MDNPPTAHNERKMSYAEKSQIYLAVNLETMQIKIGETHNTNQRMHGLPIGFAIIAEYDENLTHTARTRRILEGMVQEIVRLKKLASPICKKQDYFTVTTIEDVKIIMNNFEDWCSKCETIIMHDLYFKILLDNEF